MNRIFKNSDAVSGAALILFGAVALALSLDIPEGPGTLDLPPNLMPVICSIGIILSGIFIFLKGIRGSIEDLPLILDLRIGAFVVLLSLYYWFFQEVDFRLGSWAFVLFTMLILGCRNWRQLLIVPAATSVIIFLTFRYLFEILLPTWT